MTSAVTGTQARTVGEATMFQAINYAVNGATAVITLNRPSKRAVESEVPASEIDRDPIAARRPLRIGWINNPLFDRYRR